jgi:hypothetical protein
MHYDDPVNEINNKPEKNYTTLPKEWLMLSTNYVLNIIAPETQEGGLWSNSTV